MAQARKTVHSLGGPTYIDDPRVAEAQRWASLGQQAQAQRAAEDMALAQGAAAERRAAIQAKAQEQNALIEGALAMRDGEREMAEALLREQGWTARTQMKEEGDTTRAREGDAARLERERLSTGSAQGLDDQVMQRALIQEAGRDRRHGDDMLARLLALLPQEQKVDPLNDWSEREKVSSLSKMIREGEDSKGIEPDPSTWRVAQDEARAYGPRVYNPIAELLEQQAGRVGQPEPGMIDQGLGALAGATGWDFLRPDAPEDPVAGFRSIERMPEGGGDSDRVAIALELLRRLGLQD